MTEPRPMSQRLLRKMERADRRAHRRHERWRAKVDRADQKHREKAPSRDDIAILLHREAADLQHSANYNIEAVDYKIGAAFLNLAQRLEGLR